MPWLFFTIDEHQLELRAKALTAMCEQCNATQDQLNRAARRLDLGEWLAPPNLHDDDKP
jgi:hypothetical protein